MVGWFCTELKCGCKEHLQTLSINAELCVRTIASSSEIDGRGVGVSWVDLSAVTLVDHLLPGSDVCERV